MGGMYLLLYKLKLPPQEVTTLLETSLLLYTFKKIHILHPDIGKLLFHKACDFSLNKRTIRDHSDPE